MTYPVFVSFYCGKQYYYDCAKNLIEDCRKYDIPHDIEELPLPVGADWAYICRKKTEFYSRKLEEHKSPIFWLDVDTRILRKPKIFEAAEFDFAAFLRNFKYLREYDPVQFARTFHPGFLYFNYTESARAFAAKIAELERTRPNIGTDDFFLQEAWMESKGELDILLLPPKRIRRTSSLMDSQGEEWFYFGESGNVKEFAGKVEQHSASIFDKQRQFRTLKTMVQQEIEKGRLLNASVFLKKMRELDDEQDDVIHTLGRVLRRYKKIPDAITEYNNRIKHIVALKNIDRLNEFRVGYFDFLLSIEDFPKAGEVVNELIQSSDEKYKNIGLSRQVRLSLDERAAKIGGERTHLWWMEQPYPGNFGDVVNPYIVEKLSGIPPKLVGAGAGVLAIGSVIKFAKKGTKVWGTGSPRLTDKLSSEAEYRAVRGPLTRRLALDSGAICPPIYGDAALLLPFIYKPKTIKKHDIGLIKHFTHKEEKVNVSDIVKEIDIFRIGYEQIEQFLDEVWECRLMVSTSLHGIIVSHAYNVPVVWATFSNQEKPIPGGDVKFADYFASVGIFDQHPIDLGSLAELNTESVKKYATVIQSDPDYKALIDAAPFITTLKIPSYNREDVVGIFNK